MITYHSETYDQVKDCINIPQDLEWLGRRGFLHISTARDHNEIKGYVLSIFSNTDPLEADCVDVFMANKELMEKDKLYLQWHGVTKIVRGDKTIWTN